MSRLLKELAMEMPQSTKKIRAKYSAGIMPDGSDVATVQQEINDGGCKGNTIEQQAEHVEIKHIVGIHREKMVPAHIQ